MRRHLDVQHRHVGQFLVEGVQRGLAVIIGLDVVSFGFKRHGNGRKNVPVVIDKRDLCHLIFPILLSLLNFSGHCPFIAHSAQRISQNHGVLSNHCGEKAPKYDNPALLGGIVAEIRQSGGGWLR